MKQIFQSFKDGKTKLEDIPVPNLASGNVLIQTTHSLVSKGTEKMLTDFGRASLIEKARQQPEKVRQALDKIKSEGLIPTLEAIFAKLEQPIPLGYSNVGRVIAVGDKVNNFSLGDRVVSNGPHAQIVSVPKNLVQLIPNSVSSEEATFTVVGAIALQGIRLLNPTFGESVVVVGLGLIGQLVCQLLRANGCNVIGVDINKEKCDLAKKYNIKVINSTFEDSVKSVFEETNQVGADGVVITASSNSNDIISQAARMSRKRGKIILVGVVGLELNRNEFYEKELSFQVSCSYGPGRYDNIYEQKGYDYPLPFVRWTEKRNFESVLNALNDKMLRVKHMISNRVSFSNFNEVYDNLNKIESIASLFIYPELQKEEFSKNTINLNSNIISANKGCFGIIGAGNFTKRKIIPSLIKNGAKLKTISSYHGSSGTELAKKFKIINSTSNYKEIITDKKIDSVVIATRHNSHADLTIECINAGKFTIVEKPLAINYVELEKISEALKNNPQSNLFVGFNRRFSPHLKKIKESMGLNNSPLNIVATMNAGHIPSSHWVHDLDSGGGRIIGESCHLFDVCVYLTGSLIQSVCMNSLGLKTDLKTDNGSILLKFVNGSNAVINYFSNGSKRYSKERIEVFSKDSTWITDNFLSTEAYNVKSFKKFKTKIDKGHENQFSELMKIIKSGGKPLISFEELYNVTKATFDAIKSLRENKWINI